MYTILQEEKNIEGVVKTTYGIKCEEMAVNDVSPNKKEVTELIGRLNKYELSPCHLQDVIEDFIYKKKQALFVAVACFVTRDTKQSLIDGRGNV